VSVRRFALALAACLAGSPLVAAPLPNWAKAQLEAPRPSGDYIPADAEWLIVHDEVVVGATDHGGLRREYRQIFEAIGTRDARLVVAIDYDAAAEKLSGPTIWVPGWSGHVTLDLAQAGVDVPEVGGDFVTANRRVFASTRRIKPGRRVVVTWTVDDTESYPGDELIVPVEAHPTARFVARAVPGSGVTLIRAQPGAAAAQVEEAFVVTDVPAAHEIYPSADPWRPAPIAVVPFVLATRAAPEAVTWAALARKTADLFDGVVVADSTDAIRLKAEALTAGVEGTQAQIARLADFAQSLVYRNVEWGIGAFRPDPPSEVLRSMSADCKGKVVLLKAMLETIGVRSVPVLVRRQAPYLERAPVPTVHAFNHVVLAIDAAAASDSGRLQSGPGAGWTLFDPTDELASFGRAPEGLHGAMGLWSSADGDLFEISLEGGPSQVSADLDVDILTDGSVDFVLRVAGASGYARAALLSSAGTRLTDQIKENAQEALRLEVPGLTVSTVTFDRPDHGTASAPVLEIRGGIEAALQPIGADLFTLSAPLRMLAHALGIPRDTVHRDEPAAESAAGRRWRVNACCSAEAFRRIGTVRLRLAPALRLEERPRMSAISSPWLAASVSNDGDAWSLDVSQPRGDFGTNTLQRRIDDYNALARTLRGVFVVRRIHQ